MIGTPSKSWKNKLHTTTNNNPASAGFIIASLETQHALYYIMDINFKFKDLPIGGKLVEGIFEHSAEKAMMMDDDSYRDFVKEHLAHQLVKTLIENNLVEFTSQRNPVTYNDAIRIRCYVTPNDQVKLLRVHYGSLHSD